ncbi:hypothetical protein SRHO_G00012820 [Serrasalmus rhombeus]
MIAISDGIHNIVDGRAIGTAFSLSCRSGLAAPLAVLCHELPQKHGLQVWVSGGLLQAALLMLYCVGHGNHQLLSDKVYAVFSSIRPYPVIKAILYIIKLID